jgi:hypothetical protein
MLSPSMNVRSPTSRTVRDFGGLVPARNGHWACPYHDLASLNRLKSRNRTQREPRPQHVHEIGGIPPSRLLANGDPGGVSDALTCCENNFRWRKTGTSFVSDLATSRYRRLASWRRRQTYARCPRTRAVSERTAATRTQATSRQVSPCGFTRLKMTAIPTSWTHIHSTMFHRRSRCVAFSGTFLSAVIPPGSTIVDGVRSCDRAVSAPCTATSCTRARFATQARDTEPETD